MTPAGESSTPGPAPAATTTAAIAIPLPQPAVDSVSERVKGVLARHCARCHQHDRLEGESAARGEAEAGIADILDLDALARDPSLVMPGAPDASPLYQQMIARQMPLDVLRANATGNAPTPEEIAHVRAWIKQLAPAACAERQVPPEIIQQTMRAWLAALGPERAADTRFLSLEHIAAACASDAQLAAYRQAVVKLFNGLSWSEKPVVVETVGEALVVMAVRLSDLGWTGAHWDMLAAALSEVARPPADADVREAAGTTTPLLPADWLAHTAMQPEYYARLLGLPPGLDELAKLLGIDLEESRSADRARRAVVEASAVTEAPRIIERYPARRGVLWLVHDYSAGTKARDVLERPLLPWDAASETAGQGKGAAKDKNNDRESRGDQDRKADKGRSADKDGEDGVPEIEGTRALFTLPNGFLASMLFDQDGRAVAVRPAGPGAAGQTASLPEPGLQPVGMGGGMAGMGAMAGMAGMAGTTGAGSTAGAAGAAGNTGAGTIAGAASGAGKTSLRPWRGHATAPLANGLSCAGCHASGIASFTDARAAQPKGEAGRDTAPARDAARPLAFVGGELARLVEDDRRAVARAHEAAGLPAGLRVAGLEPVSGLARRYRRDVDLSAAAAELRLQPAMLRTRLEALARTDAALAPLAIRLVLGRLSRRELDLVRDAVMAQQKAPENPVAAVSVSDTAAVSASAGGSATDTADASGSPGADSAEGTRTAAAGTGAPSPTTASTTPPLRLPSSHGSALALAADSLLLWPDRTAYRPGEAIELRVETGRACHLTLVNIDASGKATVLFPNEFDRDNLVRPAKGLTVPGLAASYRFVLRQPGAETFVALCEVGEPVPAGVTPDLTHQNFTALGDWERFLDASVKAAAEPRVPLDNGDDIDRRRRTRQLPKARPAPATPPPQARAAFSVRIAP